MQWYHLKVTYKEYSTSEVNQERKRPGYVIEPYTIWSYFTLSLPTIWMMTITLRNTMVNVYLRYLFE